MDDFQFFRAVRSGQTKFTQETLRTTDWFGIATRAGCLRLRWSRWPTISFGQTPEQRQAAMALRRQVADQLEATPELWDQGMWSARKDGYPAARAQEPTCGTPACVAGWTVRFVDPLLPYWRIADVAWRALWCDGLPMPSFHPRANKARNLAALRATDV